MKQNIAVFVQHYLSPSMTFVYRQINILKNDFNVYIFCSGRVENLDLFPEKNLYIKKRNFYSLKYSRYFNKLFRYQLSLSINPKLSARQKKYFKSKILSQKITLIHAHFGPSAIEVFPIAKKLNIPLIITFHGYDISTLLAYPKYIQNIKKVLQYAKIFIVANSMKKTLEKFGVAEENIILLRCGIPISKFKFIERESLSEKYKQNKRITFIQISNFVEKKGHIYTLKAFSKFLAFYDNSELILAGNGYLQNKCKIIASNLGIENNIKFVGHLNEDDVFELMKKADVFLHHSVTAKNGDKEGVPTVIMEAMATGIPVISSYHSGIPELIDDGVNGNLVHEKNIDEYVEKMKSILLDGDQYRSKARKRVEEQFSLVGETEKMKEVFNTVINDIHI
jgi:glycosyltransferase involved in cell wall biosynthesis